MGTNPLGSQGTSMQSIWRESEKVLHMCPKGGHEDWGALSLGGPFRLSQDTSLAGGCFAPSFSALLMDLCLSAHGYLCATVKPPKGCGHLLPMQTEGM